MPLLKILVVTMSEQPTEQANEQYTEQVAERFHTPFEDFLALLTGSLCIGFGVFLFKESGLLTGGTAGLALILTNLIDFSFGQIFFVINLPFYLLAFMQMGWRFTVNTFISVLAVSASADMMHIFIEVRSVNIWFATVFGALLLGLGMLVLFRHKSSLGGVGILALFLQSKYNIRAGKFQMGVDMTIVTIGYFLVPLSLLLFSIFGAIVLNMVIAINHKPGRYQIS